MTAILLTMLFMLVAAFSVWSYYLSPTLKKGIKGDNNALYIILHIHISLLNQDLDRLINDNRIIRFQGYQVYR